MLLSIVLVPPSFTKRPSNQTVVEGTNVTFLCTATGNPTPTVTWMKDGSSVAEGETLGFETSRNDSGKYWCLAKNGLGEAINTTVYLDVKCKFKKKQEKYFHKKYYDNANEVKKKFNSCRVTWLNLCMFQSTRNMKKAREAI